MIKGTLLAHGPFSIAIKPEAFSGEKAEFLDVISAMLPHLDRREVYGVLARMGRPLFEKYFSIVPDPGAPAHQELDVEELWSRIAREQEAGFL
jgi:hypothetical protein